MARYTINSIREDVESEGWELLSTEYQNLNTPLIMKCSEGHTIYIPWKKGREGLECPTCKKIKQTLNSQKILPKPKNTFRVLGLDQATYISGYSIYDNDQLIQSGTFETTLDDEIERDHALKEWLISIIHNWNIDAVGIEDIQLQNFGAGSNVYSSEDNVVGLQTYKKLAHLQGIIMETLYEYKIPYKLCPAPTWRGHCGVKGRSKDDKKKSMQLLVKKWYNISVTNDEADAIGIGKYAADKAFNQPKMHSW